jgi:hypothetical protein
MESGYAEIIIFYFKRYLSKWILLTRENARGKTISLPKAVALNAALRPYGSTFSFTYERNAHATPSTVASTCHRSDIVHSASTLSAI